MVVLGSLVRPLLPGPVAVGLVGLVGLAIAANEYGVIRIPLPQNARQVPQWIVEAGGRLGGLQFGFEMGTGVRTFMTSGLPHVALAAVLLLATWPQGLLAGLMFGTGRAWMTLARLWHVDSDAWDDTWTRHGTAIRRCLTVVAAVAVALIASAQLGG